MFLFDILYFNTLIRVKKVLQNVSKNKPVRKNGVVSRQIMIFVFLTFRPTFAKERVVGNKTVLGHDLFDCNDQVKYQTQLVFDRE